MFCRSVGNFLRQGYIALVTQGATARHPGEASKILSLEVFDRSLTKNQDILAFGYRKSSAAVGREKWKNLLIRRW
jgi:hypothetical protein